MTCPKCLAVLETFTENDTHASDMVSDGSSDGPQTPNPHAHLDRIPWPPSAAKVILEVIAADARYRDLVGERVEARHCDDEEFLRKSSFHSRYLQN